MSAFYLIKQALGEDFFCWLSEKEARWAVLSQYLDSDYRPLPPIDAQRSIQASIANAGLKHEGSFTLKAKDYCSDTVADSMSTDALETCEARMCYFHTPDGPAHAVATLVKNRGEIRIMDPNFGEVSFRNQVEFGHWMSEVFNKHYAGYSNLTVAYYSMGRQDGSEADHSR